jgi:hypothetical protein
MALKSWSIASFDGTLPETKTIVDSDTYTVILLSLLISNYSDADDANITVEVVTSANAVKFTWIMDIVATNSPFALDSMIVLTGGDKLRITSDIEEVSVYASGHEE